MFRINLKKASLWWALLSILVNLVGTIEPFCGKNEALRWIILVGKQKRNVQRANPILTSACQLTITWVSNINTSNSLDSSQGFFLLGPRSHWREDPRWNLTSAYMEGRPYGRTILSRAKFLDAYIDKQILLPTALRCALRSRERRELRVKISELCVLFATLCALKHADQIKSVE